VLTGPDGKPVTDVFGALVGPQTTDSEGLYGFAGLPVLPAGQRYTVSIDKVASATALEGLTPTIPAAGSNAAKDSSTWTAESTDLTVNGANDHTLDFGFVRSAVVFPPQPADILPLASAPTSLAHTGLDVLVSASLASMVLLLTGAGLMFARRRPLRD